MGNIHDNKRGIETALEIFVGKWKPVILHHIYSKEVVRFSELQRLIPDITKKMLTAQLRELEYHDIIHREVYPQVPPKVEYSITDYGKELIPILMPMKEWGKKHIEHLKELYGEIE